MPRNISSLYKSFFVTAWKVTGIIHAAFLEHPICQNDLELFTACILPGRNAEHLYAYVQIRTENLILHFTQTYILQVLSYNCRNLCYFPIFYFSLQESSNFTGINAIYTYTPPLIEYSYCKHFTKLVYEVSSAKLCCNTNTSDGSATTYTYLFARKWNIELS